MHGYQNPHKDDFVIFVCVLLFVVLAWCALRAHWQAQQKEEHKPLNSRWREAEYKFRDILEASGALLT